MLAARYGHAELVARLLQRGASVNQLQSGGGTALIFAAQCGNALVVRLLLEARPSPKPKPKPKPNPNPNPNP